MHDQLNKLSLPLVLDGWMDGFYVADDEVDVCLLFLEACPTYIRLVEC